jgi:hypothetical protein
MVVRRRCTAGRREAITPLQGLKPEMKYPLTAYTQAVGPYALT